MTGIDMENKKTSASRVIDAPAEAIFDLLADPSKHPTFDGSGSIKSSGRPQRLAMNSRFGMSMKMSFLPYKIGNTVVEFDENRLIAWQHFGHHRWRYELEPVAGSPEQTTVTETFDWSTSRFPPAIELAGYPKQHLGNIERTLDNLANLFAK